MKVSQRFDASMLETAKLLTKMLQARIVFFHNFTMLPDLTDLPDQAFLYYFVVLFSCTYPDMSVLFMHIIN